MSRGIFCFLLINFLIFFCKSLIFLPKKIDINNKELEGVLNERYKMVKKLGEGAQGTVYEVEDLNEDRKRLIYFYLCSNKLIV